MTNTTIEYSKDGLPMDADEKRYQEEGVLTFEEFEALDK